MSGSALTGRTGGAVMFGERAAERETGGTAGRKTNISHQVSPDCNITDGDQSLARHSSGQNTEGLWGTGETKEGKQLPPNFPKTQLVPAGPPEGLPGSAASVRRAWDPPCKSSPPHFPDTWRLLREQAFFEIPLCRHPVASGRAPPAADGGERETDPRAPLRLLPLRSPLRFPPRRPAVLRR
ncbi:hypothetical protein AAFF_G00304560 [Aldrovandia affinis]|uniref:Uncharacterized protein n=1 Tax=Aldrovandia affinis TaxID=143900 RepID=A0AAD7SPF4_9TELE|nr:hypothetical protein AAFF_G00304560 [Aldrovandia affinis]